jgi:hypothetical protein
MKSPWSVIGLLAALPILAVSSLSAQAYNVTLNNGNVFVSKYRPVEAEYDPTKMLIMTDVGNVIALPQSAIASIESDTEARGFGRVIDGTTILVGYSANDTEVPAEGEDAVAQPQAAFTPQVINMPLVAEPNAPGGGIPLSFITGSSVPIGGVQQN